jgi:phage shock protein C
MDSNRLTRSRSDVMIGGVCAGLGKYFRIDATLVRLIFVLLTLAGGGGVVIYFILWIVIPREDTPGSGNLDGQEFGRRAAQMGQEMQQMVQQPNTRAVQFIGIALVVLGVVYLIQNLNLPFLSWFNNHLLWPILIIAAGGLLLFRALKK